MSQEARNEAKRLRRLKRKQNSDSGTASNSFGATGITVVGGGTLAAIAIALGVNALSPGSPNASNEDESPAPADSSQSPSSSVDQTIEPSSEPTTGVSGALKISITASPSATPSYSASPSASPSTTAGIQGSYFAEGRYGAGYYSTAYDVAFSSPMFQAGSGFYYGPSGYSEAIESPQGYFSQSGWNGSGFYSTGYFDYSANYAGSWDGSGITYPYGTGAYYGSSGFSDATHELRGSYYASGIAGAGYYASLFTGNYYHVVSGVYMPVSVVIGVGTYYGLSGISEPAESPSGSYYLTGFSGSGYYSNGYYACGYGYVTGATEYDMYFGAIGRQTYYGLNANSTPIAGPEGVYKYDGFKGTGYYEPFDLFDSEWRFGTGSYYGLSGYGTPIAPPTGMQWYYTGWGGTGFYSTGEMGSYWYEGIGTGAYYGPRGTDSPLTPA